MSTKNIKAGLSKTNVNAIAGAIGTATLNRLVPIFSTSVAYTKGEYTNYNNVLYRFTANKSAGAWDSSKVEAASLNDLIDDVNEAVASVTGKANTADLLNGTLVVAKAQIAQQIANVGDDVGSTQDEPFILQATATDNGITSAETAPIAKHLEKQGNSVVFNQLAKELNSTNWSTGNSSANYNDGVATFTATATHGRIYCTVPMINGHKYIYLVDVKGNSGTNIKISISGANATLGTDTTNWQTVMASFEWTSTTGNWEFRISDERTSDWDAIQVKKARLVDLTQWGFSADEIADLTEHPENFFRYYQGSLAYNAGTLTTSNGRYLKTIGRQQWDEIATITSNTLSNTNHIRAIPNCDYYFHAPKDATFSYYDIDGNLIYSETVTHDTLSGSSFIKSFTTPANCYYFDFEIASYGASYQDDITISIYYDDGVDYDKHYAYEEHIYDTGTETLLSAGSVRDIKLPSGEITRKVGIIDLGSLNWTRTQNNLQTYYFFDSNSISDILVGSPYAICSKYLFMHDKNRNQLGEYDKVIAMYNNVNSKEIVIRDDSYTDADTFKTAMNGVYLIYELDTPTPEQGTSFPENIDVDNYGSMLWLDTSNNSVTIPQGSQFFYPADYVEFLDSLYTRSKDGGDTADVTNIVVQSELTTEANARTSQDTILQNAIGGTLRQCLCVKESLDFDDTDVVDLWTLSWSKTTGSTSGDIYFYSSITGANAPKAPSTNAEVAKIISTLLKTTSHKGNYDSSDEGIAISNTGLITIAGTNYDSLTTDQFKAAMKGVLLAYEKAS